MTNEQDIERLEVELAAAKAWNLKLPQYRLAISAFFVALLVASFWPVALGGAWFARGFHQSMAIASYLAIPMLFGCAYRKSWTDLLRSMLALSDIIVTFALGSFFSIPLGLSLLWLITGCQLSLTLGWSIIDSQQTAKQFSGTLKGFIEPLRIAVMLALIGAGWSYFILAQCAFVTVNIGLSYMLENVTALVDLAKTAGVELVGIMREGLLHYLIKPQKTEQLWPSVHAGVEIYGIERAVGATELVPTEPLQVQLVNCHLKNCSDLSKNPVLTEQDVEHYSKHYKIIDGYKAKSPGQAIKSAALLCSSLRQAIQYRTADAEYQKLYKEFQKSRGANTPRQESPPPTDGSDHSDESPPTRRVIQ